ncbi:Phosphatase YfbT [Providencia rettgeri]|nr:Phosphatase YfbT [Providencia rettgeri]
MKLKAKGFLFDLDGTLADSLAVVERCWCKFGERIGKSADEVISYIHGKPAMTSLRHFLPEASDEEIMEYFHWLEKWKAKMWRALLLYPALLLC